MSENIYDILGKLNGLAPKATPASTAEPIYESVDPRGDIMSAVTQLEERYMGFKEAKSKKREEPSIEAPADDLTRSADPDVARLATKARFNKPQAKNDFEAIVSYVNKQEKELERAEQADIADREKIEQTQGMLAKTQANQDALRKVIDATDQRFRALNNKVAAGQITAQDQAAARAAQQIEKDHDAAAAAVEKGQLAPEQPTTAPEPEVAEPVRVQPSTDKPAGADQPIDDKKSTDKGDDNKVVSINKNKSSKSKEKEKEIPPDIGSLDSVWGNAKKRSNQKYGSLEENTMLKEYKEGQPELGLINFNDMLARFKSGQQKMTLSFGPGRDLALYDYQMYGLLADLASDQNQDRKVARIEQVMSSYDNIVQALTSPKVKKYIAYFPEYAKTNPVFKARKRDVEQDKFKLEPTTLKDPGEMPPQPHPYQQGDAQLEENSGNNKMTKPNSILEAVRSVEDKKLRESAKPDFLDLDDDGDTDEPMKSAAKSAKNDDPAKPDSEAVAKRKRLQALKDKQEDERAEKGDDYKSASRFVKGRAYGGSAQKDDDEKDLDESGLQAYLGKKKYGKEGMKALQKAGREGASKEKMAILRAKHDKMDEVAPPGAKAERMVKHIKKSLSKDGHLSGKDKAIAYATTWKAHNKGQVEEATNFGDTIKNSKAKMTKVTVKEGKEAIRNHPIYTTKEAWDHYAEELAEQEAMECGSPMNSFVSEEPVVNVQQELDEIAKLAGLPVKTCESCSCNPCKCDEGLEAMAPADSASPLTYTELDEAATRKDFRMVANLIKANPDREKAKELAHHHADIFKQQNPRFKREMFLAACGLEESTLGAVAGGVAGAALGKTPAAASMGAQIGNQLTNEEEMEEGNEFSGALAKAKAAGAKEFEVDGKKYTVKEDININVSANGEEDVVNLIRKLSGMPVVAIQAQPAMAEEYCDACDSTECHCETVTEEGPKERDLEYTNSPREEVAGTDAAIPDGADLNRAKKQYRKEYPGDNPMAVAEAKEESLWKAYESMIKDVKAK